MPHAAGCWFSWWKVWLSGNHTGELVYYANRRDRSCMLVVPVCKLLPVGSKAVIAELIPWPWLLYSTRGHSGNMIGWYCRYIQLSGSKQSIWIYSYCRADHQKDSHKNNSTSSQSPAKKHKHCALQMSSPPIWVQLASKVMITFVRPSHLTPILHRDNFSGTILIQRCIYRK